MDSLAFLLCIARKQAGEGKPVTIPDMMQLTKFSRQHCHNQVNELIRRKLVVRVSRGKYMLNGNSEFLREVGFCVVLPMDIYEYWSKMTMLLSPSQTA